jgi:SRSO17 transposase
LTITAVLADAAHGDVTVFREALHRLNLPYALGISSHLTVFVGTPRTAPPESGRRRGRPPTRVRLLDAAPPRAVSTVAATLPGQAWRRVSWQNEQQSISISSSKTNSASTTSRGGPIQAGTDTSS